MISPKSSRAEAVVESIEDRITRLELPAGYRLGTKESLRRQFDVAVGTFNEAVRLLSARGTVEIRPGVQGGVFVASPTPLARLGRKMLALRAESVSVADCLVVRDTLEPLTVLEAARHRTARDVTDLRAIVRRMDTENLGMAEYLRINWALHRRIVEITPNQVLRHTYISLLEFVESRPLPVSPERPAGGIGDGPKVHWELVNAIAAGNVERAAEATLGHAALTSGRGPDR